MFCFLVLERLQRAHLVGGAAVGPGRSRKEFGGDVAVTLAMLLSARLRPPLAFNNSTGARDPARDPGARSQ